jgi:hypothetical protein
MMVTAPRFIIVLGGGGRSGVEFDSKKPATPSLIFFILRRCFHAGALQQAASNEALWLRLVLYLVPKTQDYSIENACMYGAVRAA